MLIKTTKFVGGGTFREYVLYSSNCIYSLKNGGAVY